MQISVLIVICAAFLGTDAARSCGNYVMDTPYGWTLMKWRTPNGTVYSRSAYLTSATPYGDYLYLSIGNVDNINSFHPTLFTVPYPGNYPYVNPQDPVLQVRIIPIPDSVLKPNSNVLDIVLDEDTSSGTCDNAYAYISDQHAPGLIVMYQGQFSRFYNPKMNPDPSYSLYYVNANIFPLNYGINGIEVDNTNLYFQPVASRTIYKIPKSYLTDGSFSGYETQVPVSYAHNKSSGGIALLTDASTNCLFYNPVSFNRIVAWNPQDNSTSTLVFDLRITVVLDISQSLNNPNTTFVLSVLYPRYQSRTVNGIETTNFIFRLTKVSSIFG